MKHFIALVRNYPALYDANDPNFRNCKEREKAWINVSEELNEDIAILKKRWRNLRDSYSKYLRAKTSRNPNTRRYNNWLWADDMEVFKPFLTKKCDDTEEIADDASVDGYATVDDSQIDSIGNDDVDEDDLIHFDEDPLVYEKLCKVKPSPNTEISRKRSKRNSTSQSPPSVPANKMLKREYQQSIQDFDAIDHLFLGYAKTIKMFSLRRQVRIKHEFARLVMQFEREHLEDSHHNNF